MKAFTLKSIKGTASPNKAVSRSVTPEGMNASPTDLRVHPHAILNTNAQKAKAKQQTPKHPTNSPSTQNAFITPQERGQYRRKARVVSISISADSNKEDQPSEHTIDPH
ncbi:hypothetical protein N7456_012577 [Penicillium angulare]|uniref:Uncharacterized protein n=1 Tax=Penicillium angulare TaxID=116970 RepID=A0A9W9EK17_9EURO|nr:hypothetical protein N7456_012577 [Penicillium angulare]